MINERGEAVVAPIPILPLFEPMTYWERVSFSEMVGDCWGEVGRNFAYPLITTLILTEPNVL